MENEDLNPIDLLSFITDELEAQFRNGKNAAEKTKFIQDFLERWEADSALSNIRNMEIEFENDLDWFNVKEPLTIKMLHGKIVVLDFFTYCCINCMHVLPELNDLEKMYTQERGLNVIGVHSPKFANEKDSANLLAAAQKYNIEHPVVNDCQMKLWRKIGICCWPSLLVLSPQGSPLILLMGEGHREFLECFIGETLRFYSKRNMIKNFVIPLSLTTNQMPASKLKFPAKIARLKDENIFALADAGNHRIIIFNMDGKVIHKIGGNFKGFVDGDFVNVRFNSPQGIVWFNENELIVADTENHALRKVTLDKRAVETLAGTGSQGSDRVGGKVGTLQALASPWDVAVFRTRDMDMSFHLDEQNVPERDIILISMAGTHQIWGYFPEGIIWWKFRKFEPKVCVSIVGNGMEENRNNSYPQNAAFAQPSGITIANNYLFIADSESSSIRKVSMLDGKVMAVVGGDRNPANLFAFGDIDGKQYNAKLQHPLAVSYNFSDDKIYVADTYNHKLKAIDISSNTIESLLLINDKGISAALSEPSGLCFDKSGQNIIVSDTNNHQLQIVNVNTMVTTVFHLDFSEIHITSPTEAESLRTYELLKLLPLQLYKNLKVKVFLEICDGLKLTEEAPQKWHIFANNSTFQSLSNNGEILESFFEFELNRLQEKSSPDEKLSLKISLSLCNENSCLMKIFLLTLCNDISCQKVKTNEECLKLQITKDHIKLV